MIKLAIVDDHEMFRTGIRHILSKHDEIKIELECNNGKDFLRYMDASIDIVLMDLDMPVLNGMQTMEALHQSKSGVKVIFLSQNKEARLISSLMELGARGYLNKDSKEEELYTALLSVHENGYYFNDIVSKSLLIKLAQKDQINPSFNNGEQISGREKQVLQLICEELTTVEIAEKLFISPKTVENHRSRLMDKTGARNSAGLVVFAIKNDLVHV